MSYVKLGTLNLHDVTVDGLRLLVDSVSRPLAPAEVGMNNRTGLDGALVYGKWYRCPEIEIGMWILGGTAQQRLNYLRSKFIKATYRNAETKLEFSDDNGKYYMVYPTGSVEFSHNIDSSYVTARFQSAYPWAFGESHSKELAISGSVSLPVSGNIPTTITSTGTVANVGRDYCEMKFSGGSSGTLRLVHTLETANTLNLNTEARTVNASYFTATGYWPMLDPAKSTTTVSLSYATTSTLNLKWTDRWL